MPTIQETLDKFGFEPSTAEIYVILANNGEMQVAQIKEKTQLSRASIYDSLAFLLTSGYAEYRKVGRNAYYKLAHPNKLFGLVEQKKRENALLEHEMEDGIRSLIGTFNLTQNKPGVRFFEGEEGVRDALFDSLHASGEVLTFADSNMVENFGGELNTSYRAKRLEKQIKKRVIVTDNQPASEKYIKLIKDNITEVKTIKADKYPFDVAVEIYDDTVSYIYLSHETKIAFLIKSAELAKFHASMFNFCWDTLPALVFN